MVLQTTNMAVIKRKAYADLQAARLVQQVQ
jgi:hypothetical protein